MNNMPTQQFGDFVERSRAHTWAAVEDMPEKPEQQPEVLDMC